MAERRRWPRREVTWAVLISVDGGEAVTAKVVEASRHGLRVAVESSTDFSAIPKGTRCEVDVRLAGGQARFVRVGEVCHSGEHGLGVFIPEPLPTALVPVFETEAQDAVRRRASSLVARVRSVVSAKRKAGESAV